MLQPKWSVVLCIKHSSAKGSALSDCYYQASFKVLLLTLQSCKDFWTRIFERPPSPPLPDKGIQIDKWNPVRVAIVLLLYIIITSTTSIIMVGGNIEMGFLSGGYQCWEILSLLKYKRPHQYWHSAGSRRHSSDFLTWTSCFHCFNCYFNFELLCCFIGLLLYFLTVDVILTMESFYNAF